MDNARYSFENLGSEVYELYEYGVFLLRFSRDSFRSVSESFAVKESRSSHWVGSVLRLFLKKFPPPFPVSKRKCLSCLS
jgi:hypothetical protein